MKDAPSRPTNGFADAKSGRLPDSQYIRCKLKTVFQLWRLQPFTGGRTGPMWECWNDGYVRKAFKP